MSEPDVRVYVFAAGMLDGYGGVQRVSVTTKSWLVTDAVIAGAVAEQLSAMLGEPDSQALLDDTATRSIAEFVGARGVHLGNDDA